LVTGHLFEKFPWTEIANIPHLDVTPNAIESFAASSEQRLRIINSQAEREVLEACEVERWLLA
jgi:hypothetical protein